MFGAAGSEVRCLWRWRPKSSNDEGNRAAPVCNTHDRLAELVCVAWRDSIRLQSGEQRGTRREAADHRRGQGTAAPPKSPGVSVAEFRGHLSQRQTRAPTKKLPWDQRGCPAASVHSRSLKWARTVAAKSTLCEELTIRDQLLAQSDPDAIALQILCCAFEQCGSGQCAGWCEIALAAGENQPRWRRLQRIAEGQRSYLR